MKGFHRDNQLFSLCGLNCGLCPMHLNKYCPGCGGGEGNQSCKIAKCSLEHDGVEYCFRCREYPCEKYEHIDEFDSFITHSNRKADLKKAREIGIEAYNAEQTEKTELLNLLLANYNDGRKKTLFCVAVNLLELQEINDATCAVYFFEVKLLTQLSKTQTQRATANAPNLLCAPKQPGIYKYTPGRRIRPCNYFYV